MDGAAALQAIVSILVGGISQLGQGIATGAKAMVTALMFDGTGASATLSSFGVAVAVFGGIALAVGLSTLLFNWIRNLGK